MEELLRETLVLPKKVLGFVQLGVAFPPDAAPDARDQVTGRCPFCGKERHFQVNVKALLWDCKRCGESGNFETFMAMRTEEYAKHLIGEPLAALAKSRGIAPATFRRWGVGWIAENGLYTIPVHDGKRMIGVHRYDAKNRKMLGTTGGGNGFLHAIGLSLGASDVDVWVCEGEWDAMALDEALRTVKRKDAVVGICGAAGMSPALAKHLQGFRAILALDNDDPGLKGDARARKCLGPYAKDVRSIHWPPGREDGFDVRALYLEYPDKPNTFLCELEKMARADPRSGKPLVDGFVPEDAAVDSVTRADHIAAQPTGEGLPRGDVIKAYRQWLYLPDSEVIDVLFGAVFANRMDGDPLWLFLVGPPGCGKTELIMSLSSAPLIYPITSFTPAALISGKDNIISDPSLIPRWNGHVTAIEDFTTILQMNPLARDEIFGILRAAYGGTIKKVFGTGTERRYKSRFGIIAGVTAEIEKYGPSHTVVGERFVKYYMRQPGVLNVGAKMIETVVDNLGMQADQRRDLEDVAKRALDRPVDKAGPRIGRSVRGKFVRLAQWTAALRGAVVRDKYHDDVVTFRPTPEIGTRLAKQLCKLAQGIAVFRGSATVGLDEYGIVSRVARNSVPDLVELFVGEMYIRNRDGWTTTGELAKWTRFPTPTISGVLRNLALLRVMQEETSFGPGTGGKRWKLSASILRLMRDLNLYSEERRFRRIPAHDPKARAGPVATRKAAEKTKETARPRKVAQKRRSR